MVVHVINLIVH